MFAKTRSARTVCALTAALTSCIAAASLAPPPAGTRQADAAPAWSPGGSPPDASNSMALPLVPSRIASPTYFADIQPLIERHCASCHHEGTAAPFPLQSYRDVKRRAAQIADMVAAGMMPPWEPNSHGELLDENRITPEDSAMLRRWVELGAPSGDNHTRPPDLRKPEIPLGTPSAILSPKSPVTIAADAGDFYHCYVLPTHYGTDKYLSAIAFQPGNPHVADHALEYLDVHRQVRLLNHTQPGSGFTVSRSSSGLLPSMVIGGWGISTPARPYPQGSGLLLPKDADLLLEVHYHGTGKPETDLPKVLLYFCDKPPDKQVRTAPVMVSPLRLIAGSQSFMGERPVRSAISIIGVMPYLRARGRSLSLGMIAPDTAFREMLNTPHWDFNWIGNYRYKEPIHVPAASLLMLKANFAPREDRGVGADTAKPIGWGDTLDDENAVAYIFYTTDREHLRQGERTAGIPELGGANDTAITRILLDMFDANKDGQIDPKEKISMRRIFGANIPKMTGMEM